MHHCYTTAVWNRKILNVFLTPCKSEKLSFFRIGHQNLGYGGHHFSYSSFFLLLLSNQVPCLSRNLQSWFYNISSIAKVWKIGQSMRFFFFASGKSSYKIQFLKSRHAFQISNSLMLTKLEFIQIFHFGELLIKRRV